jgi:hypothetical protein
LAGETLHSTGTASDTRVDGGEVEVDLALLRGGQDVQHGVGGAAHGDVERHRVLEGRAGGDVARQRGRVVVAVPARGQVHDEVRPAFRNSSRRALCVASVEPLPGSDEPERLGEAVHRVGGEHAGAGAAGRARRALDLGEPLVVTSDDADAEIAVIRSVGACATPPTTTALPASIGPPDTNTVGMLRRIAALSMPGVILSQLEMQTMASARGR